MKYKRMDERISKKDGCRISFSLNEFICQLPDGVDHTGANTAIRKMEIKRLMILFRFGSCSFYQVSG